MNIISTILNKLSSIKCIDVLSSAVYEGVSENEIRKIETINNIKLPTAIKEIYMESNGFQLQWRFNNFVSEHDKDKIIELAYKNSITEESILACSGSINILPIQNYLLNEENRIPELPEDTSTFLFEGKTRYSDNEFCSLLRPFDTYDEFFCVASVKEENSENWKFMLLGDYWIEYDNSRLMRAEDYLRLIFSSLGLRYVRNHFFNEYRGDLKPPLIVDNTEVKKILPDCLI